MRYLRWISGSVPPESHNNVDRKALSPRSISVVMHYCSCLDAAPSSFRFVYYFFVSCWYCNHVWTWGLDGFSCWMELRKRLTRRLERYKSYSSSRLSGTVWAEIEICPFWRRIPCRDVGFFLKLRSIKCETKMDVERGQIYFQLFLCYTIFHLTTDFKSLFFPFHTF